MKTARNFLFVATAALLTGSAYGSTVIVSDVFDNLGSAGSSSGWQAVTWTQTGSYNDVSIAANLVTNNGLSTSTGTAYLMTAIGPGTTASDEAAPPFAISVNGNPGLNSMTPLFSNLTLGPGTYYLVINPTLTGDAASLDWDETAVPLRTLDTGVTQGTDRMLSGTVAPFAPASNSVPEDFSLIFSVSGNPIAVTPTPEPATVALMIPGLAMLGLALRRRRA